MKIQLTKISETTSVIDAAKKMKEQNIGSLLVFDASEKVYGIVTGKDIVYRAVALNNLQINVGQIASKPLMTITKDADIEEAASIMGNKQIRRLIVTNNSEIIGMVSEHDLVSISPSLYDLICRQH